MIALLPFVLFITLIVALVWLMPSKGVVGERRVAKMLSSKLPEDYVVVNDITIPCCIGRHKLTILYFQRMAYLLLKRRIIRDGFLVRTKLSTGRKICMATSTSFAILFSRTMLM